VGRRRHPSAADLDRGRRTLHPGGDRSTADGFVRRGQPGFPGPGGDGSRGVCVLRRPVRPAPALRGVPAGRGRDRRAGGVRPAGPRERGRPPPGPPRGALGRRTGRAVGVPGLVGGATGRAVRAAPRQDRGRAEQPRLRLEPDPWDGGAGDPDRGARARPRPGSRDRLGRLRPEPALPLRRLRGSPRGVVPGCGDDVQPAECRRGGRARPRRALGPGLSGPLDVAAVERRRDDGEPGARRPAEPPGSGPVRRGGPGVAGARAARGRQPTADRAGRAHRRRRLRGAPGAAHRGPFGRGCREADRADLRRRTGRHVHTRDPRHPAAAGRAGDVLHRRRPGAAAPRPAGTHPRRGSRDRRPHLHPPPGARAHRPAVPAGAVHDPADHPGRDRTLDGALPSAGWGRARQPDQRRPAVGPEGTGAGLPHGGGVDRPEGLADPRRPGHPGPGPGAAGQRQRRPPPRRRRGPQPDGGGTAGHHREPEGRRVPVRDRR